MLVSRHVILTGIFALILYPFLGLNSLTVFFSGFLFDIDHYFYYLARKKDWNFMNAYLYCFPDSNIYEEHNDVLHIFHLMEVWALLLIGSLFHKIFLFIFLGLMFHMVLDGIALSYKERLNARAWSLIGWIQRH